MKKKLAIITTHPIQYYAPLFKLLTARGNIDLKVFYTWGKKSEAKVFDPGFGKSREWDIPLLTGYNYEFLTNISTAPGSHHFSGIINPDIIDKIKYYQANAILVFGWAFQSHLKAIRYFKNKIPIFFRGDSTLLDEQQGFSIKKIFRRIFLTWVYRHIDCAFYVGTNNRDYYAAHGVSPSRLVFAPHAIDNDRFNTGTFEYEQQAEKWRLVLGISSNTSVVLFAGKLEQKKNPMLVVEAAVKMPEMHFIIAGDGALEADIKKAAENLRNVSLMPFQNQSKMPVVYRLADIFVLPSSGPGETWGLALNEAMASSRIVIASNKCGASEDLVKDGINGYIINPDIQSLITALQKLGNDKSNYDRYKKESLKHIEHYTYRHIALAIESSI